MSHVPASIAELVAAPKALPFRPTWDAEADPHYLTLLSPLVSDDRAVGGFELRAKVSKRFVDRDAVLQLEFAPAARKRVELSRCCWRPTNTHTNKAWGPSGFEFARFVKESHQHLFEDNWLPHELRMRNGSLPGARPISPDPSTLSDFIAFCGECFKINNIGMIEIPERSPDFFWTSNG